MNNPFVKVPEEYTRDLNIIKHYTSDAAMYLHKSTGKPIADCKAWVQDKIKNDPQLQIKNPKLLALTRVRDDLKIKEVITLNDFLRDVTENERILAPTMTVYKNQRQKKSILSLFIRRNIENRAVQKKAKFIAKQQGNMELMGFKANEEKASKLKNNALSGAHASTSTILRNKSSHSTLTSTCRSMTSYANANNEKFLAGNRHYYSPEVTLNNLVSIVNNSDWSAIDKARIEFDIEIPTVDFIANMLLESTRRYWRNPEEFNRIMDFVLRLSPIERMAVVYTGDLYSLAKLNDSLVRGFIGHLITKGTGNIDNPDFYLDNCGEDAYCLAALICSKETSGRTTKELKEQHYEDYCILASTIKNILETGLRYEKVIVAFWRTSNVPASVANIRSVIRKTVLTSDTDSTIFTTQFWTEWYVGKLDFSEESINVNHAITYLASQTIIHILATISAGMGVAKEDIFLLAMKNEYYFPVFSLTNMAKHYFAGILACEGVVYEELEMEIKGVGLKDSNIPMKVMSQFNALLKSLIEKTIAGELLSIETIKDTVRKLELEVKTSALKGEMEYLNTIQIKEEGSYVKPMSSAYAYHDLWTNVFAAHYGETGTLPYMGVKISLQLKNKTDIAQWIDSIENRQIATDLKVWFEKTERTTLKGIVLPVEVVSTRGIPEELLPIVDIKKIIYGVSKPYYLLLEALGFYMINDKLTRLLSD